MSEQPTPRIVLCPTCSRTVKWVASNANRPFCSERCKLIDLGEWADEGYVLPSQTGADDVLSGELVPPASDALGD